MMKDKLMFPGDFITTEEEFVSGKGTYEQHGEVRAGVVGKPHFNEEYKEVTMKGARMIQKGDIITCIVKRVRDSVVLVDVMEKKGQAAGMIQATLPVRNISQGYVDNAKSLFKIGDIIQAKVLKATKLEINLATDTEGLGVVQARCSKCRNVMMFNKDEMKCISCGNIEGRKWFEQKDERSERENRGFERRDYGRDKRGFSRGSDRRSFSRGPDDRRSSFGRSERNYSNNRSYGGQRNENRTNNTR